MIVSACIVVGALSLAATARADGFGDFFGSGDFYDNGPSAPEPARLACRGTLSFGDALGRYVRMTVDTRRGEVTTADCHKYPHLARFCAGSLIRIADHHFVFGGAESPENTKFWADLYRPSRLLSVAVDGTDVETMRVLFIGRCTPEGVRVHHIARKRDP
jgi:hypothetical protein